MTCYERVWLGVLSLTMIVLLSFLGWRKFRLAKVAPIIYHILEKEGELTMYEIKLILRQKGTRISEDDLEMLIDSMVRRGYVKSSLDTGLIEFFRAAK